MKSKTLLCIFLILLGITMISCGNPKNVSSNKNKTSTSYEEENDNSPLESTTSNINNPVNPTSNTPKNNDSIDYKTYYLDKLDSIEKGLSDLDNYYAGSTLEMKYAANEEYKRWDNALNEIYNKLKETLSEDKINELEKKELAWIDEKTKKAENAASEFEGGTAESLAYTISLAETTKSRCYELVNTYM